MRRLLAKTMQVYELGIRHIGLFLDDIPSELHTSRIANGMGRWRGAHIDLMNVIRRFCDRIFRSDHALLVPLAVTAAPEKRRIFRKLGRGLRGCAALLDRTAGLLPNAYRGTGRPL
jgi:hypothetical protein